MKKSFPYVVSRIAAAAAAAAAKQRDPKKNLGLLSFGEEAEAEEQQVATASAATKIRSAHDVLDDKRYGALTSIFILEKSPRCISRL
jgi:hypothetical protein